MTSISSYSTRARVHNPLAADPEWIHARFERAVDMIQSLPKSGPIQTNYDDKLLLYAVYKQATEGDIKTSRPGMFDVLGRAKWDAWNKRKGLSQADCKRKYVDVLLRILRGYSDRTQAVELIQELENFTLERVTSRPRQRVGSHLAYSHTRSSSSSSSGSSSSRTGSYDQRDRHEPRYDSRRSGHNLTPQAKRSHRHDHNRVQPPSSNLPPADLVAPSLPGYGPPRTRTDSLRTPIQEGRSRLEGRDEDIHEEGIDDDYSSEEDAAYASAPPTAPPSVAAALRAQNPLSHPQPVPPSLPVAAAASQPRLVNPAPPSISDRPYPTVSIRAGASRAPSVAHSLHHAPTHSGHQQVAYPASGTSIIAPLTSSNLLQQRTMIQSLNPTPFVAPTTTTSPSGPAAIPALDAALDRIQTSLTALHERLSILEQSPTTNRHGMNDSISTLFHQTISRILNLVRIRSSTTTRSSYDNNSRTRLRTLIPKLFVALLRRLRSLVGDLIVVGIFLVIVGKWRGIDIRGIATNWIVRYVSNHSRPGGGGRSGTSRRIGS
ncbi:uncharacterized protein JCM15063_002663 [Sporobolomyces koalae]|uniref:uncharacterized protein n=1 Tax=Sporobolomyces koalae TaxID=500713 RepID=UPI0031764778